MAGKINVVLTTEGTYPYYTGGVSTWADILIKQLGHIDFHVIAIMMHPFLTMKYDLPSNVAKLTNVPLWGTEEPAEYITGVKFSEFYVHKRRSHSPIRKQFHEIIEKVVRAIYSSDPDLADIGKNLLLFYEIMREHDYRELFRSLQLWDFFYDLFLELHETSPVFTLDEFSGLYEIETLCRGIEDSRYELAFRAPAGTIERLNEMLEAPHFAAAWLEKHPAIVIDDDLQKRMEETAGDRFLNFADFHPRRQVEIRKLNRLILEKTYPDICPKISDKPILPPSIYDVVESLRWFYRFFISLLTPVEEADIYHSSAAAFCGLPCVIAKLKYGTPFLLTEHGIYVREQYLFASRQKMPPDSKAFLMGLISLISRLNYHFADQISPVCAHNKRWEVRFGAQEERIKVIYNGIDVERFRRISVDRDMRPTVVMVARIDPLKDIETYLLVCAEVKKKINNVLFKLYGPVVDKVYYNHCLEFSQKLGLNGNFIFAGETATPEISNNEGDVVILTSISEAFPFAVIEGMACEKVVISSDVGGTKEVLDGYGFIVRPKDCLAFTDSIVYALENPAQMAEIGIEARLRIVSGYRIGDMVNNYGKTYEQLSSR